VSLENNERPAYRRLYRDKQNGMLCGVCAGVADFFGFDVTATRVLTVILQFLFPATFLCYLLMCFLVPKKPGEIYRDKKEEQFWKSVRTSPVATVSSVRHKLREIDVKMQRMERYITSPGFNLDKEFRDLKDD
jgi:phage shock protein C